MSLPSLNVDALTTRASLQQLVRDLFQPTIPLFTPGRAMAKLGGTGQSSNNTDAGLEGFARPLWGVVPLVAGGGSFDHWNIYHEGLTNGSNPDHPEYWGLGTGHYQQMYVEMAAIGLALALVPEHVWEPLSPTAKKHLTAWLGQIYTTELVPNNWQFFRVIVHLGLTRVGAALDAGPVEESLKMLESYYIDEGWYHDGPGRPCDYYNPFAMHFYGLIYAKLAGKNDPERAERFRHRATLIAKDFISWFAPDGAALPYGRSLTYRFAQGGFWGALAYADVEALPWGVVKGLAMRHLRWWLRQPIFSETGLLTIGYVYPNLNMAEPYNCPGSPYWAMKFFLPLALPDSHPFWKAKEEPLPETPRISVQKPAGHVLTRDGEHVVALTTAQATDQMLGQQWMRHGPAKYSKFAYSTYFGFSVPSTGDVGLMFGAYDSMLALSEEGDYWRCRLTSVESRIEGNVLYSHWVPWPDVQIETWLVPCPPWHVRIHRIKTGRKLIGAEGGFATSESDEVIKAGRKYENGAGFSRIFAPPCGSGLIDLEGKRTGEVVHSLPNTNLIHPKSSIPMLKSELEPGTHELICAVLGTPTYAQLEACWGTPPTLERNSGKLIVRDGESKEVLLEL